MTKRRAFGTIRKLPSGRFQASYIGPDAQRFTAPRTFRAKTDAAAWLTLQEASLIDGTWAIKRETDRTKALPNEFIDFAVRHIELQTNRAGELLRGSTRDLYRRLIRTKLSDFAGRNVGEITVSEVSEWWARQSVTGRITSSARAYKLLSAVLKRAVAEGLRPDNPCQVKGAHSASSEKEIAVPSEEEVSLVAEQINPRHQVLVLLAAYSGLRFGELTALKRKDFTSDIRGGKPAYQVRVERAVTLVEGKHVVDKPKSKAGVRTVPITSKIEPHITNWLAGLPEDPETLVFPSAAGGHLRHDVFTNDWKRALKKAGITRAITPHGMRHFAGSRLAAMGANLAELKKFLGDSSTSAVMRYMHDTGRGRDLVELM
jgi:integrase